MSILSTGSTSGDQPAPKLQVTNRMLRMLAPMPATAMHLLNLLANPDISLQKLADVAVRDVGVSTALLRCANSASFGLRRTIGSITDAIRVIGTSQTRMVVLASGISQVAMREMPLYELPAGGFTAHSELAANAAMSVARAAGLGNIGLAYSAGLLHDLGKVVLGGLAKSLDQSPAVLSQTMLDHGCSLLEAEEMILGANHATIGRQLAELWSLPEDLGQAIGRHHEPQEPLPATMLAYCTMMGNSLAGLIDPTYTRLSNASSIPIPEWIDIDDVCASAAHCGLSAINPHAPVPPPPAPPS
jgi:HD-like signal output (HDOD) protein